MRRVAPDARASPTMIRIARWTPGPRSPAAAAPARRSGRGRGDVHGSEDTRGSAAVGTVHDTVRLGRRRGLVVQALDPDRGGSAITVGGGRGSGSGPTPMPGRAAGSAPAAADRTRRAGWPRDPAAPARPRPVRRRPAPATEDEEQEPGQRRRPPGRRSHRASSRWRSWSTSRGRGRRPAGPGTGDGRPMDGRGGGTGGAEHERSGQTGRTGQPGPDPWRARRWHRQMSSLSRRRPRIGGGIRWAERATAVLGPP